MSAAPDSLTRARETRRTPEEVGLIVQEIADLMAVGRWKRGRSYKAFAEREGVSLSQARAWAARASSIAWAETDEDRAEMRASALGRLERLANKAERDGRWRDAVAAVAEAADIAGLKARGPAVSVHVGASAEGEWKASIAHLSTPDQSVLTGIKLLLEGWDEATDDVKKAVKKRWDAMTGVVGGEAEAGGGDGD